MEDFDAVKVKDLLIKWIHKWFYANGRGCNAIVGISGGKDSSIVAALLCEALGKNRVIGVLMPDGQQNDIDDALNLVKHLGIEHYIINIHDSCCAVLNSLNSGKHNGNIDTNNIIISEQTMINLPARIRMTTLYAIAQSRNGRVVNTCNLSENYVGYATRYGDAAGDFSPLGNLTVTEVKEVGRILGLPDELVDKTPSDGLCGKTDEDNLGFTYEALDEYINTGKADEDIIGKIKHLHNKNMFKFLPMPSFPYVRK